MAAVAMLAAGCSKIELSGIYATRYQEVKEQYCSVEAGGSMDVTMSAEVDMIEITADSNVLPYLEIYVEGNVLHLGYTDQARFSPGGLGTRIRVPYISTLKSLRLSDAAFFTVREPLCSDNSLNLEARSGAGFHCDALSVRDFMLSLYDGASFSAGFIGALSASLILTDGSAASFDGDISSCDVIIEDGSSLGPRIAGDKGLYIEDFYCNMKDGSSAEFSSLGTVSGIMRDGCRISCTGDPDTSALVMFDGSEIRVFN